MSGLEALQESIDPLHQSHLPSAPARHLRNKFGIREKKMVELSPLTVDKAWQEQKASVIGAKGSG